MAVRAESGDVLQVDQLFAGDDRQPNYRRLIVLVPNAQIDEQGLIARTIKIAALNRAEVLFLGLGVDRSEAADAHRRLGAIASKARGVVVAYAQVLPDVDWMDALRKVIRPADCVLMPADLTSSLEAQLAALRIPVFRVVDLRPTLKARLIRAIGRVLYEITPLLIIVGFLWLQIQIAHQTAGFLNAVLTGLTLIVELGLVVIWSLFLE